MNLKELITNPEGRLSTADAFLFFGAGAVFALWLAAGVLLFQGMILWDNYAGWFNFGRDFVYGAVALYIGKRATYKPISGIEYGPDE